MRLGPLNIDASERARFLHAFAGAAFAVAAAVVTRAAGTSLLLEEHGAGAIASGYLLVAAVLVAGTLITCAWLRRSRLDRVLAAASFAMASLCALACVGMVFAPGLTSVASYVVANVIARLLLGLFWALVAVLFHARESRRLLGLVGAGGTAGALLAGLAIPALSRTFGTESLLLAAAALLAGLGWCAVHLFRTDHVALRRVQGRARSSTTRAALDLGSLNRTPLLRMLAGLVAISTFTLFLVDFSFLSAAREQHEGAAMAAFLGRFYAWASLGGLIVQLLLVGRILQRGLLPALIALPAALMMTAIGVAATGAFEWVYAAKILEPVLCFTLDAAAFQVLFQAVPRHDRGSSRTLLDGLVRPVAVAVTAGLLLGSTGLADVRVTGLVAAIACVPWIALATGSVRAYVGSLVDTLQARLDSEELEHVGRPAELDAHLREALATVGDDDVLALMEMIPDDGSRDWAAVQRSLLRRESAAIKLAALAWFAKHGSEEDLPGVAEQARHPAPEVRLAVARALSALGGRAAAGALRVLLEDPSLGVRAAAAQGLVAVGDFSELAVACGLLESLRASADPRDRAAAATAIGGLGTRGLTRSLERLLADDDVSVRRAALEAVVSCGNPDLLPSVLALVQQPGLRRPIADALVALGSVVPDALLASLPEDAEQGSEELSFALAQLGDEGLARLDSKLDAKDVHARWAAALALTKIAGLGRNVPADAARTRARIELETRRAVRVGETLAGLPDVPRNEALLAALREELRMELDVAVLLLAMLSPRAARMGRHLGTLHGSDGIRRAQIVELVDNLARGAAGRSLVRLLETPPRPACGNVDDGLLLQGLIEDDDTPEWVLAGALHSVARRGGRAPLAALERLGEHASPAVRECARDALARLGDVRAVS